MNQHDAFIASVRSQIVPCRYEEIQDPPRAANDPDALRRSIEEQYMRLFGMVPNS